MWQTAHSQPCGPCSYHHLSSRKHNLCRVPHPARAAAIDFPNTPHGPQQNSAVLTVRQSHGLKASLDPQVTLPDGVLQHQLPKHVALIMDGNSRWAEAAGLPAWVGHERGVAALRSAVMYVCELGIPTLTVYAFSVENWQRDAAEVSFLMKLFESALQQQLPELQQNGVQLRFIGDLHRLPASLQQQVAACQSATASNTQLVLNVAVSYGAQQDMTRAVQQLARLVQAGQLQPEQITRELISQQLASSSSPPPDLLIRTSGEQRLSNFLLWECAYTELCFLDCMWPDFSRIHFAAALQQFAQRQRRYGQRTRAT